MMGLGMGAGVLFLVVVWAVLIVGAVWLVRTVFPSGDGRTPGPGLTGTPRQILDQRYARGDISRDEYERMRADLES